MKCSFLSRVGIGGSGGRSATAIVDASTVVRPGMSRLPERANPSGAEQKDMAHV